MARSSIHTHLSLSRFARIFGINPIHFSGASGSSIWPGEGCGDVWPQHSWQRHDIISREDVGQAIHDAEEDIKRVLGTPVAPEYFVAEQHVWPKVYDHTYWGGPVTASGARSKAISAKWGQVVDVGRRGTTVIDADAAVVYSDPDGDGWDELATITATTTVTDANEIRIFVPGKSADPAWEIKPLKTKAISSGTVTITLESWLLIDPTLWETFPTPTGFSAIDVEDTENYLTTVDVYREYMDKSSALSQFAWETGPNLSCSLCLGVGCASCTLTTQNGCLVIRGAESSTLTPLPATYSDGTWTPTYFSLDREPDYVNIWYKAGIQSQEYLAGRSLDPLSDYMAQAIAWLAVARLEAPPCGCGRVTEQFNTLRKDLSTIDRSITTAISIREGDLVTNPFGTREGEYRAWNRVSKLMTSEHNWKSGSL